MTSTTCPITGSPAVDLGPTNGDWRRIECDATGGVYEITGSAAEDLPGMVSTLAIPRLVTWLVDQRRMGTKYPRVTTELLARASGFKPMGTAARVDRVYRMLQSEMDAIDLGLAWYVPPYAGPETEIEARRTRLLLRAWTESYTNDEVDTLVKYGVSKGFVREEPSLGLTIDGLAYLEAQDAEGAAYDQAFVAMWFNDHVAEAYEHGIEPAIRATGYRPMRIDRKEHNNKIDDEIIAEIRRSRFLIADFTCGMMDDANGNAVALPRGGVYYEAGFAQGLGIPVIWTCRADHINHVHFDTRQFNHITWTSALELRERLIDRIGAVLGDGPLGAR
jgi:hypothetical protein